MAEIESPRLCKSCVFYRYNRVAHGFALGAARIDPADLIEHQCRFHKSMVTGHALVKDAEQERNLGKCGPTGANYKSFNEPERPQ